MGRMRTWGKRNKMEKNNAVIVCFSRLNEDLRVHVAVIHYL